MDAGPGLNFFSVRRERLLFKVLGPLSAPTIVEQEILRKARTDSRFGAAEQVINKLPSQLLEILPDEPTPELIKAVERITDMRFTERIRRSQDLGEIMVIAHAVAKAEAGNSVIILIDEREGTELAQREAARLNRLRKQASRVGSISLVTTIIVLERAVRDQHIAGKNEMRKLYERLRDLDDGLPHIQNTTLLSDRLWG